jgi:catalase
VAGRLVGIVVDHLGDLDGVEDARQAVFAAGAVPLVIAARGGVLEGGLGVQRTFLTGRSVELDAVLVAGCPAPALDALPGIDAKAGAPEDSPMLDPRVALLLQETGRHAKAIGAWGDGATALTAAGLPATAAGLVVGDAVGPVTVELLELVGAHRAWERFAAEPVS